MIYIWKLYINILITLMARWSLDRGYNVEGSNKFPWPQGSCGNDDSCWDRGMIETMNCLGPSSQFDGSTKYMSQVKKICSVHLYRPTPLLFRSWDGYKESKDSLVKPVQRPKKNVIDKVFSKRVQLFIAILLLLSCCCLCLYLAHVWLLSQRLNRLKRWFIVARNVTPFLIRCGLYLICEKPLSYVSIFHQNWKICLVFKCNADCKHLASQLK